MLLIGLFIGLPCILRRINLKSSYSWSEQEYLEYLLSSMKKQS